MEDNDHRETEIVHHVKEQVSQKEKIARFASSSPVQNEEKSTLVEGNFSRDIKKKVREHYTFIWNFFTSRNKIKYTHDE